MPPLWDPEEEKTQAEIYQPVHQHSSGVISYTLPTPKNGPPPSIEVSRMLEELREAVHRDGETEITA